LKETNGKSDQRTLDPRYRKSKINQKLSFKIRGHSIFLLYRISRAKIMRRLSTKRSAGLPASSVPTVKIASDPNHLPRGFDPQRSNQKVGTQRA
jgi:hypothetical protein